MVIIVFCFQGGVIKQGFINVKKQTHIISFEKRVFDGICPVLVVFVHVTLRSIFSRVGKSVAYGVDVTGRQLFIKFNMPSVTNGIIVVLRVPDMIVVLVLEILFQLTEVRICLLTKGRHCQHEEA